MALWVVLSDWANWPWLMAASRRAVRIRLPRLAETGAFPLSDVALIIFCFRLRGVFWPSRYSANGGLAMPTQGTEANRSGQSNSTPRCHRNGKVYRLPSIPVPDGRGF